MHHLQTLIAWLEDAYIRRLPVSERSILHKPAFRAGLIHYLTLLSIPVHLLDPLIRSTLDRPSAIAIQPSVAWLVDLSLNFRYSVSAKLYNVPLNSWKDNCIPVIDGISHDTDIAQALTSIIDTLKLPSAALSSASLDVATVAADVVQNIVNDVSTENLYHDRDLPLITDMSSGIRSGDEIVDRAATVIRALHVRELRTLQDDINQLISDLQSLTANPQTNTKLGKVGW